MGASLKCVEAPVGAAEEMGFEDQRRGGDEEFLEHPNVVSGNTQLAEKVPGLGVQAYEKPLSRAA